MREENMIGKVVLITGATGGIGKETARALYGMGAHVIIVGRDPEKTATVVEELSKENPGVGTLDSMVADLSSLKEIRRLAYEFKEKYTRLDVLINNAGAYFNQRKESVDGYEMTFALNHLGYFYLTYLLFDLIKASAPARIINVSSGAHAMSGGINFDNLQNEGLFLGWTAYGRSKLMNILFTRELCRRLQGTGVTANALHPGFVATNFGHNGNGIGKWIIALTQRWALTPEEGAQTSIYLASAQEVAGVSGAYFVDKKITQPSNAALDEEAARKLWEISLELTGEKEKSAV